MKSVLQEPTSTQRKQTSKFAIASLVLGILSILNVFLFPTNTRISLIYTSILFAVPSIIAFGVGIFAIKKISKSTNLKGTGLAIAGLVVASPQIMFGIGTIIMMALH